MASFEATCAWCGKAFRMTGDGSQSVAELQESVPLHRPGSEGDENCAAQYGEQAKERELEAARSTAAAAVSHLEALGGSLEVNILPEAEDDISTEDEAEGR